MLAIERDRKAKAQVTLRDFDVLLQALTTATGSLPLHNVDLVAGNVTVLLAISSSIFCQIGANTLEVFVDRPAVFKREVHLLLTLGTETVIAGRLGWIFARGFNQACDLMLGRATPVLYLTLRGPAARHTHG
jgi:hypothetical protein